MDEISESLGMSKKTLYQYFPSKYELLVAVTDEKICTINNYINSVILDSNLAFIEKVHLIIRYVTAEHSRMKPHALNDIQKSVPDIWKKIVTTQQEHILVQFSRLLEIGKQEGYIRDDIPTQVISMVYATAVLSLLSSDLITLFQITASQAFEYAVKIVYEGIFTEKGLQAFRECNS